MRISPLLCFVFVSSTIVGSEIPIDTNMLAAAIIIRHHIFDTPTLQCLKAISKSFHTLICEKENERYSIIDQTLKNTVSVKLICSKCLAETCIPDICRFYYNKTQYRGLLCRTTQGGNHYKVYLIAPETNELVEMQRKIGSFSHILKLETVPQIVSVPTILIDSDRTNNFSYHRISKPYFIQQTTDVGILEGIPRRKAIRQECFIPELDTVYECVIADNGAVTRRPAYFSLNGKLYRFGILCLFPLLYDEYVFNIEKQLCEAKRDGSCVVFLKDDCYKKYLTEESMPKVLAEMFPLITSTSKNASFYRAHTEYYNERTHQIQDKTDLVRFALCAKLAGNKKLAIDFLRIYDYCSGTAIYQNTEHPKQDKNSYKNIQLRPFGTVYDYCNKQYKDQINSEQKICCDKILQELTTFATIQEVIENAKKNTSVHKISNTCFAEIRQDKQCYTFYLWRYENWNYNQWVRHNKDPFTLLNCNGKIISIKNSMNLCLSGLSTRRIQDVTTILVTEEREKNDKKTKIKHTLCVGHVTDAQANISTEDSNVSNTQLSTSEIQNTVDTSNTGTINQSHVATRQYQQYSLFNFFNITLTFLQRYQRNISAWMYKKLWYDILPFPEKKYDLID